jgi:hypothetical protein
MSSLSFLIKITRQMSSENCVKNSYPVKLQSGWHILSPCADALVQHKGRARIDTTQYYARPCQFPAPSVCPFTWADRTSRCKRSQKWLPFRSSPTILLSDFFSHLQALKEPYGVGICVRRPLGLRINGVAFILLVVANDGLTRHSFR